MTTRIVSGVVLAALALLLTVLGGAPYDLGVTALSLLALSECYALLERLAPQAPPYRLTGYLVGGGLLLLQSVDVPVRWLAGAALLSLLVTHILMVVRPSHYSFLRWALTVAGIAYITGLSATLIALRSSGQSHGVAWLVLIAAITWGCDTAAYFVGRAIGRHPFFPAISPKKTLEGAIGGVAFGSLAAVGASLLSGLPQPPLVVVAMAVTGTVAALLGDLVESALKREAGVKDSGTLIPGHGGVLDRIDSLLFVSGVTFCWYSLLVAS